MREKWILETKKADFNRIGSEFHIQPVTARLIVNRGMTKSDEIKRYLSNGLELCYDASLLKDGTKAVNLMVEQIKAGKTIAIGTDFDNDGIISGYTLHRAIVRTGGKAVIYAPNRVTEGYGLNRRIVDDAKKEGCELLVTCDNGIAAFDAVSYAKECGLTVIVTDHHEIAFDEQEDGSRIFKLPEADAIVNPKQKDCKYPFKGLCGAGVVYKLICLLYKEFGISIEEAHELLEYTAIATVADVMDLVDENRMIVKYGLSLLRKTKNIGLKALIEECRIIPDKISAYHIGFIIGPCFNAAGRLDTVAMALGLLMAETESEAARLAKELRELNEERKDMTVQGVEQAIAIIESTAIKEDKVLLVLLKNTHESLVGIIAGRLRELYHKPALVFTEVKEGIKGSARSIEAYNMFEELLKCKDLLTKFGGHPMAAGLSLKKENFELLRKRLNDNTVLCEKDFVPVVKIDVPLPIGYINAAFLDELEQLEPFGKGNPKPLFAEQHFKVISAVILGKNQNVLKMKVLNEAMDTIDALYFGDIEAFNTLVEKEYGSEEVRKMYQGKENKVDLAFTYYPSLNEFRGMTTVQIVIQNYCRIKR